MTARYCPRAIPVRIVYRIPRYSIRLNLALNWNTRTVKGTDRQHNHTEALRRDAFALQALARRAAHQRTQLLLFLRLAYGSGTHATAHVAGREVPNHLAVRGASHDGPPASLVGLIHADLTHAARFLFGFLGEGRSRQERGRNRRSDDRKNKLSDRVHRSPPLRRP